MPTVLVVDDERTQREIIAGFLQKKGWRTLLAAGGKEAVELAARERPDAVVMDIRMPDLGGREAFRAMRSSQPQLPVVLMTAFGEIRDAVEAIKEGAADYLTKPVDLLELLAILEETAGEARPAGDGGAGAAGGGSGAPDELAVPGLPAGIVAESRIFRETLAEAALVAPTEATCLITGESGTGKEVLAELIHGWSARAQGPLVRVNVAALPKSLIERELFGHVRGAFTGAVKDQIGHIAAAEGGTLFLDEIGELPTDVQSRLLRALETKEFYPIGATASRRADIRLILATNRDVEEAVERGILREDFYYRINVFRIRVPALRERPEDVLPLARSFLQARHGSGARFSPQALSALTTYSWPGNVRELRNVIERASIVARGDVILPEHLPDRVRSPAAAAPGVSTLLRPLEETERLAILEALRRCRGNRTHAAELLKISRKTLLNRLKAYGIGPTFGREG